MWVKTRYKITGDDTTISELSDILIKDDQFVFYRAIPVNESLLVKSNEVVDELIELIDDNKLDHESCLGVSVKTFNAVHRKKIDSKPKLSAWLIKQHPNKLVTSALDEDYKSLTKMLSNKKEHGYYNVDDYSMCEYGCPILTYNHELEESYPSISGSFITRYSAPTNFFETLSLLYPIHVDIKVIDPTDNENGYQHYTYTQEK